MVMTHSKKYFSIILLFEITFFRLRYRSVRNRNGNSLREKKKPIETPGVFNSALN